MQDIEIDLLANRLNHDAVVFKGCTMNELVIISGVCFGFCCALFGFLGQLILGNFLYGIAVGFLMGGALVTLSCTLFERMRRGQEKGYLQQLIKMKCAEAGIFTRSEVIRRSGTWMIGRGLK